MDINDYLDQWLNTDSYSCYNDDLIRQAYKEDAENILKELNNIKKYVMNLQSCKEVENFYYNNNIWDMDSSKVKNLLRKFSANLQEELLRTRNDINEKNAESLIRIYLHQFMLQ